MISGIGPYSVLVVEDSPDDSTLIKIVFAHADPNAYVHLTQSAEEAIAYLRSPWSASDCGSDDRPNVIVLDILMPGMGGARVPGVVCQAT